MPLPLSPNKSRAVKAMLALSMDIDIIATKTKCSTCTVRRIRSNLASFGTVQHLATVKRGRPSNLTPEMQQVCVYAGFFECINCRAFETTLNFDVPDILMKWSILFGMNMV